MNKTKTSASKASSRGIHFNTGNGPSLLPVNIDHPYYIALLDPDAAFWSLIQKDKLGETLSNESAFMQKFLSRRDEFLNEIDALRFGLKPSAVYFNPTDLCNLNCSYCYIPEKMRSEGKTMTPEELIKALEILKEYFKTTVPEGLKPQIIFHGAEPLMAREAVFAGIDAYLDDFRFGVQTNGTLLDEEAIAFLTERNIGIGLSLDSHLEEICTRTRKTWDGDSVFGHVVSAMNKLKSYANFNVICTVTRENMDKLVEMVDFFHEQEVPICMLNQVRCTRQGARNIKPLDHEMAEHYFKALDRTYELHEKTGRKLVVANFANILVGVVAPAARRLMCDISPCGGGRCFFALSASGDLFPCSEFVGVERFKGGNLFTDNIDSVLQTEAFRAVTERVVEKIDPCKRCAVRHFCGSPCPAEAHEMNGGQDVPGAFCELYEEQVRYALRLIADGKEESYLWDEWDADTTTSIDLTSL